MERLPLTLDMGDFEGFEDGTAPVGLELRLRESSSVGELHWVYFRRPWTFISKSASVKSIEAPTP